MITDSVSGEGPYGYKWIGENGFTSTRWYTDKNKRDKDFNDAKKYIGRKGNFTKDVQKLKR